MANYYLTCTPGSAQKTLWFTQCTEGMVVNHSLFLGRGSVLAPYCGDSRCAVTAQQTVSALRVWRIVWEWVQLHVLDVETLVGLSRKTEGCQHIVFNPNRTLTYKHLKNIVITFNLFLKVNLLLFSMRFVSLILWTVF